MSALVIIFLAIVGTVIGFIIYFKGHKSRLSYIIGIMSIVMLVIGFNDYNEIKRDASVYRPLAEKWLEAKKADRSGFVPELENKNLTFESGDISLQNYSIYCIYYSPDSSKAVIFAELPSSRDDLVMVFSRSNKKLDEVSFIPKDKKPAPVLQNKIDPGIFFYK